MRVVVGRIGRAQGIRGEVNIEVRTDAPEERFSPGASVFLVPSVGPERRIVVRSARWQGARFVVGFAGVADRTAAEALRGIPIEADVDILDSGDDEFHDLALVGIEARDVEGAVLGRITEVLHLPGQDVLVVERAGAAELLVPFVLEIVPEVDLAGGFVVVDLPEGLANLAEL